MFYILKKCTQDDFVLVIVAIVSQIMGFCLQTIFGKFVRAVYYLGHIYVVIYSESSNNTCDIDILVKLSTVKTCVWNGSCQKTENITINCSFYSLYSISNFSDFPNSISSPPDAGLRLCFLPTLGS